MKESFVASGAVVLSWVLFLNKGIWWERTSFFNGLVFVDVSLFNINIFSKNNFYLESYIDCPSLSAIVNFWPS